MPKPLEIITDDEFKTICDPLVEALKPEIGSNGQHPVIHVVFYNPDTQKYEMSIFLIDGDFNDSDVKKGIMEQSAAKCVDHARNTKTYPIIVILASEAWMTVGTELNRVMPSEDPQRMEIIQICGMSIDHKRLFCFFHISRDKKDLIDAAILKEKRYFTSSDKGFMSYNLRDFWRAYLINMGANKGNS